MTILTITGQNQESKKTEFYIGTYTNNNFSTSEGIYKSFLSSKGELSQIKLMAKTENPSYLTKTKDQQFLISVNTDSEGTLTSFKINKDKLTQISTSNVEKNPCFISTNNGFVLTANYTSGSINLHAINNTGELSKKLDTQKHYITTPSKHKRQKAAFAHSCYFEPNSNHVISVDLGANKIMFWTLDKASNKLIPNVFNELEFPSESGPRLITFHPTLPVFYVVNELSSSVSVIQKNIQNNTYTILETIKTLPKNFTEQNTAAHIEITNDAQFLYMSNRGHDSIGVFKVKANDGTLTFVENVSVHGQHPRNFALSPDNQFLIVANRDTDNICSFKRNTTTGKLTFVYEVKAPKATCILF